MKREKEEKEGEEKKKQMGQLRHVVTCFLSRKGKVLILKRSLGVGTYRGRWAGVSGYIEPGESPLRTAFKEVREETGLDSASVTLVRIGRPFAVGGTPFVVHPFLFEAGRGRVRLDWEHSGFKWVDPRALPRRGAVPGLGDALRAVLAAPSRRGRARLTRRG